MNKARSHQPLRGYFPHSAGKICSYGMFNRFGGVSTGLYASCNVGRNVGDSEESVLENRRRIRETMGIGSLLSADQVHGAKIYCLTEPAAIDCQAGEADALITNLPDIGLMIQQADCQAVLLFDPVREVIAAVHCGWRGSTQRILQRVIKVMEENYGTVPQDMYGMISPSLGPCCAEFVNFKQELPSEFHVFMVREVYFDFWRISRWQMVSSGMAEQRIQAAAICTCCSEDYFSYRRATRVSGGITGRNCSVICLKNG